ncbi:hypothetical protein [Klebsiella phage phiKp_21]|nr:hypothetical protein [Klebsiella phage phiKp_21]
MTTNINFIIPISNYSGYNIDDIVTVFLTAIDVNDMCEKFQNLTNNEITYDDITYAFMYDYLYNTIKRYPEILENINNLRKDNNLPEIK